MAARPATLYKMTIKATHKHGPANDYVHKTLGTEHNFGLLGMELSTFSL